MAGFESEKDRCEELSALGRSEKDWVDSAVVFVEVSLPRIATLDTLVFAESV